MSADIITRIVNSINNINTNNNFSNVNNFNNVCIAANSVSVKENTVMNAFNNIARRAAALLAFGGLLALSHTAANADVVIDKVVGPQYTYGVTAGTTALQVKVRNTDADTVTGLKIQTCIYQNWDIWCLEPLAMPASSAFSLGPNQSEWITIAIPAKSSQGLTLQGSHLNAKVMLNSHVTWLYNFLDTPAQANVQITGNVNAPSGDTAGTPFTTSVTNNGYVTSQAQTITVTLWANADGRVSPYYTQTVTIPALQVGEAYIVTFTMPSIVTYNNTGYSDIKGYLTLGSQTVNFSF